MQPIDKLIRKRLDELCPQLHLDGFDRIVWQFCKKDMYGFLQYLKKYRKNFGGHIKYAEVYYFGQIFAGENLASLHSLGIMAKEYDKEFREWADMFIGLWWKKFNQRVKLRFDKPTNTPITKLLTKGRNRWAALPQKEKDYIVDRAMKTLLENGELCCPVVIMEQMIRVHLGRRKSKKEWKFEDTVDFAKHISRTLKEIAYTHGVLLFVFPSKQAYMSEWRGPSDVTI